MNLCKAIRKYGVDCWSFEVIENNNDKNYINEQEIYWINFYNTIKNGYNICEGGLKTSGMKGHQHTSEAKEKMRKAKLGKKLSKEHVNKISNALKGKNIGNTYFKGKHHSEKTKEKMSNSHLGENNPMFGKHDTHPMFGKHHTDKAKEKMRQAKLGNPSNKKGKRLSEETKEKIRKSCIGRKISESQRLKASLSSIGEKNPAFGRFWLNNGIENKYVYKEEIPFWIEKGFKKGMFRKS